MKGRAMWKWIVLALGSVGVIYGQAIEGPPTEAQIISELQARTVALEEQVDSLNVIIADNVELIRILRAELDDVYQPTEPWHTEIIYIHNRMDGLASKWAAHESRHVTRPASEIRGRRP
jgi:hypothetical protein